MKQQQSIWVITALVTFAVLVRVMLYPFNFSPIVALALFGGACIPDRRFGFFLPVLAMFASDLVFELFNIAPGFWGWNQLLHYGLFVAIAFFGSSVRKISIPTVAAASVGSSLFFYLISNSTVWIFDKGYYARSFSGWIDCLVAGLPFLKNGMLADLLYSGIFFAGYVFVFRSRETAAKA